MLAIVAWFTFHSREPKYQGKKLSHWLWEMEVAPDTVSPAWKESVQAVRVMGTNAIPCLLGMIKVPDTQWKRSLVNWAQESMELDLEDYLPEVQRRRAVVGFRILGKTAEPAVSQLTILVSHSDLEVASSALNALTEIGGPGTLSPMLSALTNDNARVSLPAAAMLGSLRSKGRAAVPALIHAMDSHDSSLRAAAARALGDIGLEPDLAVPVLIRGLNDSNSFVRFSSAMALSLFGTQAESALPRLRDMPPDGDDFGRRILPRAEIRVQCEQRDGGIIRGPKEKKQIAFVFTGHEYAEGGETILNELEKHEGRGSFFLTGAFLSNTNHSALVNRMINENHYVGPHSDQHLLYCSWENKETLVTEEQFGDDLLANAAKIPGRFGEERRFNRYFLPAFEHYNREIYDWTRKHRWTLINYTPGTRSNADYTGEADKNFVSSQTIFDSILKKEAADPKGLNGFILLLHIGSGSGRTDKFHARFGELLDVLHKKGYEFVRVDQMLGPRFGSRFQNPNVN